MKETNKPKTGAPRKGENEGRHQLTVSIPKEHFNTLGLERCRELARKMINMGFEQAIKK